MTFTVLTTWHHASQIVSGERSRVEGPLRQFVDEIARRRPPLARVLGTAVFLNRVAETAPMALRANVEHNKVLHDRVIVLSIGQSPVPRVPPDERVTVVDLAFVDGRILFLTANFGYLEDPDVPAVLEMIQPTIGEGDVSYFLSRVAVVPGSKPTMALWRKRLFDATSHIAADAAVYFGLPPGQTAIVGARIELWPGPAYCSP